MRPVGNFENVLAAALEWAGRKHAEKNQTWGGGRPYADHLKAVEAVLLRFGFSDPADPVHQNLRLAAMAHDLLEDTDVRPETIRILLGPDVLDLVAAVTNSPGKNRAERHALTYPRIAATPWATTVKLADRIANIEESLRGGSHHLDMYAREAPGFRNALFQPGTPEAPMWDHLNAILASVASQEPPEGPPEPNEQPMTPVPPAPQGLAVAILPDPWF